MVEELLRQTRFKIKHIYYTRDYDFRELNETPSTLVSENELERISGFKTPSQVLAVVDKKTEIIEEETGNCVIALDEVRDPGNLGTIIRTAEWFGFQDILLSPGCVDPFNPKVLQASMGAFFRVNLKTIDLSAHLINLKNKGYRVIITSLDGENLFMQALPEKIALVIGSESHGISDEIKALADLSVLIPGAGESESLNAAVAAGISMAHLYKELNQ